MRILDESYFALISNADPNIRKLEKGYKCFMIGGFEYDSNTYNLFLEVAEKGNLVEFFNKYEYNTQCDNVQVYLIINDSLNYRKLITIMDYYDFMYEEVVIDEIERKIPVDIEDKVLVFKV